MNYLERMPHQYVSKLKRVEYGPNGIRRRPKVEAYKCKGISAWAWLIITLLWAGILIAGLKSCADGSQLIKQDERGFVPNSTSYTHTAYSVWLKLDLNDPMFMPNQAKAIYEYICDMSPKRFRHIILAICFVESGFMQFDKDGNWTRDTVRGGKTIGAMRISNQPWAKYEWIDYERIKWDAKYNVECGTLIFLDKWRVARRLKLERPGLAKISQTQLAIQLYFGLLPLKSGVDRWEYSRLIIKTMREKPWEKYLE